jgi:ribosomal protein S18 acetylase RimI-like enzyme
MNHITIRSASTADLPFLWDMLFESAFTTDEARTAWRSDPQPPAELMKYLDGYGRHGDAGVVAEDSDGTPVGAAWYRIFTTHDRGDGILARANVPELAIAVAPEHRGRSVGRDLLSALARRSKDDGYHHLMLSVDPNNASALRLYERIGFTYIDTEDPARGTSLIMQLDL